MSHIDSATRDRIRELNDAFRESFDRSKGLPVLTAGVASLPSDVQAKAIREVVSFVAFDEGNDPHGEHDFGVFELAGQRFFWKIDYYDQSMEYGSEDPADPAQTTRVATIMLAEEY